MEPKFWKTKSFLSLDKKWKKKLAKSGFDDIEKDEDLLMTWSCEFSKEKSQVSQKHKEEYYYMATQFLNDYVFETQIDKIIWEYHSNGISFTDISKLLKKVRIKMPRERVGRLVKKLRTTMYSLYNIKT